MGARPIKTRLKKIRLAAIGEVRPREFALVSDEISIGSAAENDLVIEEGTVSRRHAALSRRGGELRLSDLASTNGTYINGRRITGSMIVRIGDELGFGSARYVIRCDTAHPSARVTMVAVVAILFAAGFALTQYLLNWNRIEQVAGSGGAGVMPISTGTVAIGAPGAGSPSAALTTAGRAESAHDTPETTAVMAWLGPLNRYRLLAGISPVAPDADLSAGDAAHARYLVKNYGREIGNLGAAAHSEDPAKPWYTTAGAAAARASNVNGGYDSKPRRFDAAEAIDGWISIPFHRLWILNPDLHRAGYGQYCEAGICVGALNVLAGADPVAATPKPRGRPIEFPPDGSALKLRSGEGEWPDPLAACPGYSPPMGLAITLQLGALAAAKLSAYSIKLAGDAGAAIEACGFDAGTYVNPDPAQQSRVRDALRDFGAVVVVPRAPLRPGTYTVSITASGRQYTWSFSVTA